MRRRELIAGFGSVAVGWPFAARAQQPAMPVIGFLGPSSLESSLERLRAFHRGLKETGHVEGENFSIIYRWAENNFDRLPALAGELVKRQVAVIAATQGFLPAVAAKAATTTIPIVFNVGDDPVRQGLVTSLSRPGGNLTGINFFTEETSAKRLELLRELVPGIVRVAVLVNPANVATKDATLKEVADAANAMGLQIQFLNASSGREIAAVFATFARERPDAVFVGGDALFTSRRVQLATLTARYAIPATFSVRDLVEAGGLMSYGSNLADAYRQVGVYVGRILGGAKPADLPVVQATKLELVINQETARILGINVPQSMLVAADEVIE
jgi:putative tryptophan/tyrosine transport system substrate-binding protein